MQHPHIVFMKKVSRGKLHRDSLETSMDEAHNQQNNKRLSMHDHVGKQKITSIKNGRSASSKEIKLSSVYIPKEHICLPKVSLGYIRTCTTLIPSERYHLRHDSRPNERKRAWSSWTLPQIKPPTLPWMPAPLGHCSLGECKGCAPHPCGIAPHLPVKMNEKIKQVWY